MRTRWQPAQNFLSCNDGEGIGRSGSVQGGGDVHASRTDQLRARRKEAVEVGNMLDYLECEYAVERTFLLGQFLGADLPIIDS